MAENINRFIVKTKKYQDFKVQRDRTDSDVKVYVTLRLIDGRYYYSNGEEAVLGETYTSDSNSVPFTWDKYQKRIVAGSNGYFDDCDREYESGDTDWIETKVDPFTGRFLTPGYVQAEGIIPEGTPYYLNWAMNEILSKSVTLTKING